MKIDPEKINKVLVVALSCIGDMLLASAALQNLKAYLPHAKFTIYAEPKIIGLLENDPMWEEIRVYDRKNQKSKYHGTHGRIAAIKEFREGHYDLIIDLRSTLIPLFCNARYEPLWGWRELFLSKRMHEAERNINCMSSLGVPIYTRNMRLLIPQEVNSAVMEYLGKDAEHLIILNPGASVENKKWGTDNFISLANMLCKYGWTIGVIGYRDDEQKDARKIIENINGKTLDFSGKVPIMESAARISFAKLFITNDTGPLHIASALNIPTVSMFGSTDPARFGSWNNRHESLLTKLPCWPCNEGNCKLSSAEYCKCIRSITPQAVFNAATRVLPELTTRDNA
jgi:ADP-heptose:LPS heptosyltransferase